MNAGSHTRAHGRAAALALRLSAGSALSLGTLTASLLFAGEALAAPQLRTTVGTHRVEVNQPFSLELSVMGDDAERGGAFRLLLPRGFEMSGPRIATYRRFSIGQTMQQSSGLRATWRIIASRPGTYTIGPPSVQVGSKRYTGDAIKIEVVAAGSGPRSRPFDPFGLGTPPGFPGLFDDPDDDLNNTDDLFPAAPEEFRTDKALDPTAFIRATVTPQTVVVGEPLVYRAYAYGGRGPFNELKSTEPTRADFLAYPVIENSMGQDQHRVRIGDVVFTAVKIRETVMVPIKTGDLVIGPISMGFGGQAYAFGSSRGLNRESAAVHIRVIEPPAAGRPVGYTLGDVGNFVLKARVEPRTVEQGDSVSVVVRLEGQGNLPAALKPPQQNGVEWLEPNVQEQIDPSGSSLGGWRRFSYTARLTKAGEVELGSFKLPYWNPSTKRYETAQADLGSVRVDPSKEPIEEPKADTDARLDLAPRLELGSAEQRRFHMTDAWYYWLLLLGGPLGVALVHLGGRGGRRFASRLKERKEASETRAFEALSKARDELKAGNTKQAASELERALLHAIEAGTRVKARGVLRADLPAELQKNGTTASTAEAVCGLLDELDAVRFTGASLGSDVVDGARDLMRELGKLKPKGSRDSEGAA
ncbi:MAG: BatD family protein [Polyangiaceae bacterium]|nr:BatD family protein [Polyangiaceae bacterium]